MDLEGVDPAPTGRPFGAPELRRIIGEERDSDAIIPPVPTQDLVTARLHGLATGCRPTPCRSRVPINVAGQEGLDRVYRMEVAQGFSAGLHQHEERFAGIGAGRVVVEIFGRPACHQRLQDLARRRRQFTVDIAALQRLRPWLLSTPGAIEINGRPIDRGSGCAIPGRLGLML